MSSLLVKKIPSEDRKNPPFITTANGRADSTEEATVDVNDLDVLVTMTLLEDSPAVVSLVFIMRRNGLLLRMEIGGVAILEKDRKH